MKKKNKLLFLALSSILFLSCGSKNKENKVAQYTIEQFMDNESIGGGSFSPDNSKVLIHSNRSGIYNAYTIPIKGGKITPITKSDSTSFFAESYFPNDNRILLSADGNGDEIYHLYVINTDGTKKDITPEKGCKSEFYGWSRDDLYLYYGSNKRDPRYFDVYKMSTNDFSSEMIYKNENGLSVSEISHDENYFVLTQYLNTSDCDLFLFDIATKETIKINENKSANQSQEFSKDDSKIYYTTDDNKEFSYLMWYDLKTKKRGLVRQKPWDIFGFNFSENGKYMIINVNEDGKNTIEVLDSKTGEPIDLPQIGTMNIRNIHFSKDEQWLRVFAGGSNSPSDLYSYNIETKEYYKLTDALNESINIDDLVTAKVIRFKSFDSLEIPAIYFLPHQASPKNKVPAMIYVHGGPGGQSRQNYNPLFQYMLNNGIAILAVNNRGSSGYGKTFYKMDDLNHGEKDLLDCVNGKKWLQSQVEIDSDKIGIIGGSYGGYMTMAALTYTPEEFSLGVNIFGVTNWLRTLKNMPTDWEAYRQALYSEVGDPFSIDSVRLKRISPLFHTEKVTKPLMVLQGSKDPRVLQVESDEIVAGVRKNGVPVEYLLFEDEGHGFLKKENEIKAYKSILSFLNQYLKGDSVFSNSEYSEIKKK